MALTMLGWSSGLAALYSCSKRFRKTALDAMWGGMILTATISPGLPVPALVDGAHAAFGDLFDKVVIADSLQFWRRCFQGHSRRSSRRRFSIRSFLQLLHSASVAAHCQTATGRGFR